MRKRHGKPYDDPGKFALTARPARTSIRRMMRWWSLSWRSLRPVIGIGLLTLTVSASADRVAAQRVYRWTDERGVVHFSDSPPPGATNVEVKDLPRQPTAAPVAAQESEAPPPDAVAAAGTTPTPKRSGKASVEVVDQTQQSVGDALYEFSGTVENTGGSTAEDVVVIISVSEPNQGADCVTQEAEVSPSRLAAGARGKYSVTLENPCFHGPIDTEVRTDWE